MMRPSVSSPTGTEIGCAGVGDLLAAHQAFGGVHRDGAHGDLAEMLRDFEHQPVAVVLGLERVQDRRQVVLELHVDDGADDLGDLSDCVVGCAVAMIVLYSSNYALQRLGAGDDLDQFLGDHRLARAVVGEVCLRIISPALRVALSIADMRAPCSDAAFSSSARNTCTAMLRGRQLAENVLFLRLVFVDGRSLRSSASPRTPAG